MKSLQLLENQSVPEDGVARMKAEILSNGLALTETFIRSYGAPYLEKRRAYGNSDPAFYKQITVPQELFLGSQKIVCSVNIRPDSPWALDYDGQRYYIHNAATQQKVTVDFPIRPRFYDAVIGAGVKANSIATLYGGGALGIFVYGSCALVENSTACKYCSIKPNRQTEVDFEQVIKPEQVYEVIRTAIALDSHIITQVMINGGNFKEGDKSFKYYIEICRAARRALTELGSDIELHLIAYPPNDFELFKLLNELDVHLAMNMEAFDVDVFNFVCPGKTQRHIYNALKSAAAVLTEGHVYSIVVGGLEDVGSMKRGFAELAKVGVTPIINVFHPDPDTELENTPPPSVDSIMTMGKVLQELYASHPFMKPFYSSCGRNALDTEAHLQLFGE